MTAPQAAADPTVATARGAEQEEPVATARGAEHHQPIGPIAELVVGLAADLLGVPTIELDDDFLRSGGSSLLAARFAARLSTAVGVPVRLNEVLENPVIGEVVALVEARYRDERGIRQEPLRPAPRDTALPASIMQENQLLRDSRALGLGRPNPPRIVPLVWPVEGRLDPVIVQATLDELVRRHEAFRTAFEVTDTVTQRIAEPGPVGLTSRSGSVDEVVAAAAREPFAFDGTPLLRGILVEGDEGRQTLVVAADHTVFDGFSADVLFGDFAAVYRALHAGDPLPPVPPFQQADCVVWQNRRLHGETRERILGYWRGQLGAAGPFPPLDLPGADLDPPAADWLDTQWSPADRDALFQQARRHDVTLFTVLLGAVQHAVARTLGRDEVIVHSPVINRDHPDMEHVIGWFATSAVFRTRIEDEASIQDHLDRVRSTTLDAYAHQVPLPVLTRELQTGVFGGARTERPPRVFLGFDERLVPPVAVLPGATLTMVQTGAHGRPQPGLSFYTRVDGEGLNIALSAWRRDTSAVLYPALLAGVEEFLRAFVADPKQRLGDLGASE